MTVDKQETVTWDELPATITTYLTAHEARDAATAITAFTADAVVTDEGEGDFPGGTTDLHFRFTMDGALVSRLVIEP
jgi:hypothetical protein